MLICSRIIETLEKRGQVDPYYHAVSRPQIAEAEATVSDLIHSTHLHAHQYQSVPSHLALRVNGHPILLVHVSSQLAAMHIRDAQTRMLPIYRGTCPQYLSLR